VVRYTTDFVLPSMRDWIAVGMIRHIETCRRHYCSSLHTDVLLARRIKRMGVKMVLSARARMRSLVAISTSTSTFRGGISQ